MYSSLLTSKRVERIRSSQLAGGWPRAREPDLPFTQVPPVAKLGVYPVRINTTLTLPLPVLGLAKGGTPGITARTMTNVDPPIILLEHALEKKFEGCRNVRVIACGLDKLLPGHRVCFCVTRPPYDSVDYVKQ